MNRWMLFCLVLFLHFPMLPVTGQDVVNEYDKITDIIQSLHTFSQSIPQEKVYLHFDNTSYYQGDNIWFKCYVVTPGLHQLSGLSKTLYVELLNPGGEIIDKRILKIEDGQCHGDFSLTQLPFYSGFYEVRAYTRYMLNFGEDVIFSRMFPVFDAPKTEGDFEEKRILNFGRWGIRNYPVKRASPQKGKNVNLHFYPEGGNLIQGIASIVAFEATDENGVPIAVAGTVMDADKQPLSDIKTIHEGRGVFTYKPRGGKQNDIAEVDYNGRKYRFDMPTALPQGVVMEVDNLSCADSINITLRKTIDTPSEMLGVTVINGGSLHNYCGAYIVENELHFRLDKTQLPSGVSQIVLFNNMGEIVCDRLIFNNRNRKLLDIKVQTGKSFYQPYELVDMEFSIADSDDIPENLSFSLSIRDGANEVESNHNIMTDLLLMSEIKGYVRNPYWYFEGDDDARSAALRVSSSSASKYQCGFRT